MAQKHVYSHTASKASAKSAASVKMSRRSKRARAPLGGGERASLLHGGLREVEAHHLIAPLREQARIMPAPASRHRHARASVRR